MSIEEQSAHTIEEKPKLPKADIPEFNKWKVFGLITLVGGLLSQAACVHPNTTHEEKPRPHGLTLPDTTSSIVVDITDPFIPTDGTDVVDIYTSIPGAAANSIDVVPDIVNPHPEINSSDIVAPYGTSSKIYHHSSSTVSHHTLNLK